jgi:hypothetical protein
MRRIRSMIVRNDGRAIASRFQQSTSSCRIAWPIDPLRSQASKREQRQRRSGPVQRRRQPRTCRGAALRSQQWSVGSHVTAEPLRAITHGGFSITPGCPRAAEQVWMRCTVADNAAQTCTGWHCWGRGMLHMSVLYYVVLCRLMLHLELSKRAPDGTARGWAAASTLAAPRR